jgi:hypothetical protein
MQPDGLNGIFSYKFPMKQILISQRWAFICQRRQRGGCHCAGTLSRRESAGGQAGGGFDCPACSQRKATLLDHVGPAIERFNIRSDQWDQCLNGVR